ncbi:hypothetical protein BU15DRAFT_83913 [Melanogaster broomeanus]|nr:hypothetical protein BU15DRAFT_83913 [Melanogaster broomeanus]
MDPFDTSVLDNLQVSRLIGLFLLQFPDVAKELATLNLPYEGHNYCVDTQASGIINFFDCEVLDCTAAACPAQPSHTTVKIPVDSGSFYARLHITSWASGIINFFDCEVLDCTAAACPAQPSHTTVKIPVDSGSFYARLHIASRASGVVSSLFDCKVLDHAAATCPDQPAHATVEPIACVFKARHNILFFLQPLASSAHFPTAKRLTTQPLPAPLSPLTPQPRYQLTPTFATPDYIPWSLAPLSDNEEGLEKENHPASATKREILKHARSLSVEAEEKPKMKKLKAVKAVRSAPLSTEEADGGRWSEDDVTKFIVEIFENRWDEFKHNRNRVLKTIMKSKLLSVPRNLKALSSKYDHLRRAWRFMYNFETWTGNGGGDPDLPEREIDDCIQKCRNAGRKVGTLSASSYKLWMKLRWYQMMAERLEGHPGTCREDERNSSQLSELELIFSDTEDEGGLLPQTPARAPSSVHKRNMSTTTPGVPVPSHKTRPGRQSGNLNGGAGELLTVMTAQAKFRNAKEILREPEGLDEAIVEAARSFVAQYFTL